MAAKKSRRSGSRPDTAAGNRFEAGSFPYTRKKDERLADAETLAVRWLHIGSNNKEVWYHEEPRDRAVMEVQFVRLADRSVWQIVARLRVKLHDRFNSEIYPLVRGKQNWTFAGYGERCVLWMRPASPTLLRKLKVKP